MDLAGFLKIKFMVALIIIESRSLDKFIITNSFQ